MLYTGVYYIFLSLKLGGSSESSKCHLLACDTGDDTTSISGEWAITRRNITAGHFLFFMPHILCGNKNEVLIQRPMSLY